VGFGAIDRAGDGGKVIFSDISAPLLERCREAARSAGVIERCGFVNAAADDLRGVGDASVDVVTTRSVLIYVSDKARAFAEFYRVLRPNGRIAIWEPINRFNAIYPPEAEKWRERMPEIAHLWARLDEHVRARQPLDTDPMMDFDAHDLLRHAEAAGFSIAHLTYDVHVMPAPPMPWDAWMNTAGNPNIPTTGETLRAVLSDDEMALFEKHARPVLERGGTPYRSAVALLSATKCAGGHDA
jgi:SAM-dependent methyltransferase